MVEGAETEQKSNWMRTHPAFVAVAEGERYAFRHWPNAAVPRVCAGIYTIWQDAVLLYAGMAGRALSEAQIVAHRRPGAKSKGLFSRLNSHACGRRSGDQFCLYVCDRLVLPVLDPDQIEAIGKGALSLDRLVRAYVHEHLSYRFAETRDSTTALLLEREIRQGSLAAGKPLLNPLAAGGR
jgi:hypothetical protein